MSIFFAFVYRLAAVTQSIPKLHNRYSMTVVIIMHVSFSMPVVISALFSFSHDYPNIVEDLKTV
jgi:hypothetical protein